MKRWELVTIEQFLRERVAGVVGAGTTPALPDFFASRLQNRFVRRVLPQHEGLNDFEEPLTLDLGDRVAEGRFLAGLRSLGSRRLGFLQQGGRLLPLLET